MSDQEETTTTVTVTEVEISSSGTAPPAEETVTAVAEQITVSKKASPPPQTSDDTSASKSETFVVPAKAPEPKPSKYETKSQTKSTKSSYSSYSRTGSKKSFREYTDTGRLLHELSRDYRGTSPGVLENIATHPALYSKQYMPDTYRPSLSARSRKVIRDAEELALVTPGLKNMLEVQYTIWLCLCLCVLSLK